MLFTEHTGVDDTKNKDSNTDSNSMLEQFQELEQKIEILLGLVDSFKEEKKSLLKKIDDQENNILLIYEELEKLQSTRDSAQKILIELTNKLTNKINQVEINPEE